MSRKGASLLELVIAIIVMGIAMMTLPLMLTITQNGNAIAMQQEAIFAARTQLGDMLTYLWDENSIDTNNTIAVLDTNSSESRFERVVGTNRRIGHVKGNKRRKYFSTPVYATAALGMETTDNNIPNDIDDFNGISTTVHQLAESAGIFDYRYDLNMTTTVSYINDNFTEGNNFNFSITNTNHTTNIKMTKLTLTGKDSNEEDLNITLRTYSCNIGENQLLRRSF